MDIVGAPGGTSFGIYPHLFTLRDGDVAAAGPINSDVALLDPATGAVEPHDRRRTASGR